MPTQLSNSPPAQVKRADILAEARTWLGTPWVHEQRKKGAATDCIGFVVETLRHFGYGSDFVYPHYSPLARPGQLLGYLDQYLTPIQDLSTIQACDVLVFKWKISPTHLAFLGSKQPALGAPFTMLHTWRSVGRVVETVWGGMWPSMLVAAYRVPGAD